MTHLPYIVTSYGIALAAMTALTLQLIWRLRRARQRLGLLDRRDGSRPA